MYQEANTFPFASAFLRYSAHMLFPTGSLSLSVCFGRATRISWPRHPRAEMLLVVFPRDFLVS